MISDRRRAASQTNGQKSRGPRSSTGKARSSRNAWRHGLSTIHRRNPKFVSEIEQIAKAICDGEDNPFLLEQALIIAEADVLLRGVRDEIVAVLERLQDTTAIPLRRSGSTLTQAKARSDEAEIAYEEYCRLAAKNPDPVLAMMLPPQPVDSTSSAVWVAPHERPKRDEHDVLREAMPDLIRLYRYERRAWSRQKRAFHAIIDMKSEGRALEQRAKTASPITAAAGSG